VGSWHKKAAAFLQLSEIEKTNKQTNKQNSENAPGRLYLA
jgi:hypothetical protein